MKIAFINGSPKCKDSASGKLIEALKLQAGSAVDSVVCRTTEPACQECSTLLAGSNVLVFVFPLYVDGIPSHLLRFMDDHKNAIADTVADDATVYAIVNNGFYEGRQNCIALDMMRNFCRRCNLKWGQGIGIGAGSMILAAPIGHGPMKNLGKALTLLVDHMKAEQTAEDVFIEPNFPKFLYHLFGDIGWKTQARKNRLTSKDLYGRIP